MTTSPLPRVHTPLSPIEIANCGIMAGLTVALGVLSAVFPVFQLAFHIAAIVPIAMIATAFRPRATIAVMVGAIVVSGAVGGALSAAQVAQSCVVGSAIGALHRRRSGRWGASLVGILIGTVLAALTTAILWVFEQSRILLLEATRASLAGYIEIIGHLPGMAQPAAEARRMLATFLTYWWVWVPVGVTIATLIATLVSFILLGIVLGRLHYGSHQDHLSVANLSDAETSPSSAPCPLPLRCEEVSFHYEATDTPILEDVTLSFHAGEFVVITGANGSGKSTLAALLAGATPTGGTITSPGSRGLGRAGGTAFLTQRSEVQIVGDTVWEDLLWGLQPADSAHTLSTKSPSPQDLPPQVQALHARAHHCLERVGLGDKTELQTQRLSGGELQRLALAGALMRTPALLICDETTAMVDPAGRACLLSIFAELAAEGTCVLHITHDLSEAAEATRLIRMDAGRVIFDGTPLADPECARVLREGAHAVVDLRGEVLRDGEAGAAPSAPSLIGAGAEVKHLWLAGVTHYYDVGTPWEKPVLEDVDCIVSPGQTVLITGENGSGKSTLARIMAGLIHPTWGRCTLANRHMWARVGAVAISHQFARLQLLRPSVAEDIVDAAGMNSLPKEKQEDVVAKALAQVGLSKEFAARTIDQLSGGQMRRVVLAGLVAAEPAVLILDEPFAGLDQDSRRDIVRLLAAQQARGTALVIISHDIEGLAGLCERHLILDNGRLRDPSVQAPAAVAPLSQVSERAHPYRSAHPMMPRPLPWESGLSRMWLGTKILCWAALSTMLLFIPSWLSLGASSLLLAGATLVARVPLSALPRFPAWFWASMLGGMLGAWMGDGLLIFVRALCLSTVIMWGTALIVWTSPASDFPPTIRHLLTPLRWIGMPVKEWAHVMAMTLKSVPFMRDQSQSIADTLAVRHHAQRDYALRHEHASGDRGPGLFAYLGDLTTASLSVAAQRASDLGRAMSMRGGIPPFPVVSPAVGWRDLLAGLLTVATVIGIIAGHAYEL